MNETSINQYLVPEGMCGKQIGHLLQKMHTWIKLYHVFKSYERYLLTDHRQMDNTIIVHTCESCNTV